MRRIRAGLSLFFGGRLWLAAGLLLAAGCAGAPGTASPTVSVSSPTPAAQASPLATVAAPTAVFTPSPVPATPAASPAPVQGLRQELALADQEMSAARASTTLADAQQHAQMTINTLVGAWGRWYDVSRWDDPSDRRGVFPGERVPGPANDTSTDLTPIGWGIRAYDQASPADQAAIQAVVGNVKQWRDSPRLRYDAIEHATTGTPPNPSLIAKLDGQAMRALAWARLIITSAATLDQARTYAQSGAQEAGAALAAVQSIP